MRTTSGYSKGIPRVLGNPALLEKSPCMGVGEEQHENQGNRGNVLMAGGRATLKRIMRDF